MRKNLLALSIAAMVGGLSGAANAQAVAIDTVGVATGGRLFTNAPFMDATNTPMKASALRLPRGAVADADTNVFNADIALAATQLTPTTTGIGHILLVPYFSTQGSNATLLNLVNTDAKNGKAVKLRFRGAANSDDLFDITIYLSPGDMWTANVSRDAKTGVSRLETSDTSCTLPSIQDIKDVNGNFKTNRVEGAAAAQTLEGYVEILNMADIPETRFLNPADAALFPGVNNTANPLYTATKHTTVNGVWKAPCTQAVMDVQENALVAYDKANDPAVRGYSWPTGGLMANWVVVNVADSASFSGEAVALRATPTNTIDTSGAANLVWAPQTPAPIGQAIATLLSADPLLGGGAVRAASYDFPDLSTPYVAGFTPAQQAIDLSDNLRTKSVINEYLTGSMFSTDWVFSMPTRRYAVALDYNSKKMVFNTAILADARRAFDDTNTSLVTSATGLQICVDSVSPRAWDREENTRTTFVISPDTLVRFCGETSVLSFNNAAGTSVLGAKIAKTNIETKFAEGWFRIETPGPVTINRGLPIIGFAAAKVSGANLGGTWKHRTSK